MEDKNSLILSDIFSITAADGLVMQRTKASTAVVLTEFTLNTLAPEI